MITLLAAVMIPAAIITVVILIAMASDLAIIRRIAQVYEARADEQWRREHEDLISRIHERSSVAAAIDHVPAGRPRSRMNLHHIEVWHCMASGDQKTACSGQWPEDGREHGATNQYDKVNCIPCLQVVIAEMRAGFKAIRKIADNEGVADTVQLAAEARPAYSPAGNYCSECDLHDSWCEHVRPPGGAA